AEVAQPRLTRRTLSARRDEREHHVVAGDQVLDPGPAVGDDPCPLIPAEDGEAAHRDAACDQVLVGVAHPGRLHLDLHLVLDGIADLDLLDRPRLVELPDESAFCLHRVLLSSENCSARLSYLGHTFLRRSTRSVPATCRAGNSRAAFLRPRCVLSTSACPWTVSPPSSAQ